MFAPLDRRDVIDWEKRMARQTALTGRGHGRGRGGLSKGSYSIACLAFVAALSVAFWTGAVWIVQQIVAIAVATG